MISSCIDWLSVTFKPQEQAAKFLMKIDCLGESKEDKPLHGYDSALKYTSGIVAMWCQQRDDMGCHVVLSGKTLETLALAGISTRTLLESAIELHGKISRLDLAIDAIDENVAPDDIYVAAKRGLTKGTARNVERRESIDGGITVYIGSRESDKFARLYDKGVESKTGTDWKRLEIELKGDVAKQYGRMVAMQPESSIATFAWSTASKMLMTNVGNYPVYGTKSELISMPKIEKTTDTERWIHTQIIPMLQRYIEAHPESSVYDELIQALIKAKTKS